MAAWESPSGSADNTGPRQPAQNAHQNPRPAVGRVGAVTETLLRRSGCVAPRAWLIGGIAKGRSCLVSLDDTPNGIGIPSQFGFGSPRISLYKYWVAHLLGRARRA